MREKQNNNLLTPDPATLKRQKDSRTRPVESWNESSSDWDAPPADSAPPSSPNPIALDARGVSLRRGSHQILTDVSLTLHPGDTLGLLGLNGAGKSTLLNILSGSQAPVSGTVHIGEDELYEQKISARMNIGYAPDKPAVYPEFRIVEFLSFIAQMRRIPKSRQASAIDQVIEKCALGDVRKRIIGNLSTGYQQRVNLAQALIHEPRIVILDEPSNGLDPVQLAQIRGLIKNLSTEQVTVFSSHLLSEVNATCNRVLLIHQGRKILDSKLAQLTSTDNNTFELTTDHDVDSLSSLPGVSDACSISPRHWIITGKSMTEAHLKTMLQTRGIKISSLVAVNNYLETLFTQLNQQNNCDSDSQ